MVDKPKQSKPKKVKMTPQQETIEWLNRQVKNTAKDLRKARRAKNTRAIGFNTKRMVELGMRIIQTARPYLVGVPA